MRSIQPVVQRSLPTTALLLAAMLTVSVRAQAPVGTVPRTGQVFGTGGPRAGQLAARVSF